MCESSLKNYASYPLHSSPINKNKNVLQLLESLSKFLKVFLSQWQSHQLESQLFSFPRQKQFKLRLGLTFYPLGNYLACDKN